MQEFCFSMRHFWRRRIERDLQTFLEKSRAFPTKPRHFEKKLDLSISRHLAKNVRASIKKISFRSKDMWFEQTPQNSEHGRFSNSPTSSFSSDYPPDRTNYSGQQKIFDTLSKHHIDGWKWDRDARPWHQTYHGWPGLGEVSERRWRWRSRLKFPFLRILKNWLQATWNAPLVTFMSRSMRSQQAYIFYRQERRWLPNTRGDLSPLRIFLNLLTLYWFIFS
jgi:hypothetical protein